jgi:hypothetical protein
MGVRIHPIRTSDTRPDSGEVLCSAASSHSLCRASLHRYVTRR